jgi:hypothetical protein
MVLVATGSVEEMTEVDRLLHAGGIPRHTLVGRSNYSVVLDERVEEARALLRRHGLGHLLATEEEVARHREGQLRYAEEETRANGANE